MTIRRVVVGAVIHRFHTYSILNHPELKWNMSESLLSLINLAIGTQELSRMLSLVSDQYPLPAQKPGILISNSRTIRVLVDSESITLGLNSQYPA